MYDEMNHEENMNRSQAEENSMNVGTGTAGGDREENRNPQSGYSYGTYDTGSAGQDSTRSTDGYRNPYSSSYGSNNTEGGKRGKKKGTGRVILAIALAAIFGICAGAGVYVARGVANGTSFSMISRTVTPEGRKEITLTKGLTQTDNSGISSMKLAENTAEETAEDAAEAEEASGQDNEPAPQIKMQTAVDASAATVTDVSDVVEAAMPSIVSVYNNYVTTQMDWYGRLYSRDATATGSGIIVAQTDDELLIVTNNHVVADAESLEVQFINEATAEASIRGTDEDNDLAVITVKLADIDEDTMNSISIAIIGDSDSLRIGEPAIAIGNALGYGQSVTAGVISAVNREMQLSETESGTTTFIQTDAAINPGNSGGALLNIRGEVIGINSNKIGGNAVEGMGFAIPISRAEPIIEHLMNKEVRDKVPEEEQGYLGINGVSVTAQVASAYNMPRGAFVAEIMENGGAADSELQKGDIITAVNGEKVKDMDELKEQLSYYRAGEEITLTVQRTSNNSYEEYEVKVTLGDRSVIEEYEKQHN